MNAPTVSYLEDSASAKLVLSTTAMVDQVQIIQHAMAEVMKDGEHYGVVPGCGPKKVLLKPGAEKLCLLFRLAAEPEITLRDMGGGHREYETRVKITHIVTGQILGYGVGTCSTMESKYRYRADKAADTITEFAVPKSYWDRKKDTKNPASGVELQTLLAEQVGESGKYGTKKVDEVWMIVKRGESTGEKVENVDIADTYNTVLKMSKKRGLVDGVLNVTAASDIFTQDLEETNEVQQPAPAANNGSAAPPAPEQKALKVITEAGNIRDTIVKMEIKDTENRAGKFPLYVFTLLEHEPVCTFTKAVADAAINLETTVDVILSVKPNPGYMAWIVGSSLPAPFAQHPTEHGEQHD